MKLTCVTAVFNAIKSGNRENLIRCVRSVAALKTEHEHLIYDGGSTDGTVELLRELEREVRVKSSSSRVEWLRSSVDVFVSSASDGVNHASTDAIGTIASTGGCESGALIERALPAGIDRRACAVKKVEERLAGVDEAAFEAALVKSVEEKSAAGEYVFEKEGDIAKSIEAAKNFFLEYSRRIVELSDGRCVYFAPDPRSKMRNSDNAVCWAEYAFHSVSSGGDRIPGKNYTYRHYSPYKIVNTDLIEPTLRMERCVPVLKSKSVLDAVKFFGTAHLGGLFDVVVRLDEYGNVNANMTEVTFEASTKRGQKKLPQLVSLTEAIRTVVSHQTATGTCPPNENSIAFYSDENKGGESGAHTSSDCLRSSLRSGDTIERALPKAESSAIHHSSSIIHHSPTLRVVSEPDTGIYNALNKGVRDAHGDWFYVLGCDDYICAPERMDLILEDVDSDRDLIVTNVYCGNVASNEKIIKADLKQALWQMAYCHQGVVMKTDLIRRYGCFDERYSIAADFDLLLKCHLNLDKFSYLNSENQIFACYGYSGISSVQTAEVSRQLDAIDERFFMIEPELMPICRGRRYFPVLKILPLLFHHDLAIRISARFMLRNFLRACLRMAFYPVVVITRPLRHRENKHEAVFNLE